MNRSDLGARIRNFAAELRRRKVIRAAIAYAIVGVGVAEGAAIFLPPLGAPEWLPNVIAVLVVLGFPVAMALSWAFDIVPESEGAGTADGKAPDAARATARMEGQRLAHYDIIERLGVGGMGVVYKARDSKLDRLVALKVLSDHLLADKDAADRFLIEAKAAAALDHPNICAIHEIGETDDGRIYIAMQYYEGETLREKIEQGPVPLPQTLDIAAQICRGLDKAGGQGIIHRDIKPANIVVTKDGTIKVLDFGLAKFGEQGISRTGIGVGTIAYMSPEQTRGDDVDQRTDIWSLGVVLYEMLTGSRPFRGGNDQAVINSILEREPKAVSQFVPSVPAGVESVIARATSKDPARRYADAATMLADLENLLEDPSCQVSPELTPSLPPEGERRRVTVIACAIEGFESLLEKLDPEQVELTLGTIRGRVESVVADYGGVLNEFSEDRFVALFGVPLTHEDDQLRAVRAALQIRAVVPADATVPHDIELHFAIDSGQVAVRAADAGERQFRIGGTLVRETARLAARAAAGEILVPSALAKVVQPFVSVQERSEIRLRHGADTTFPLAVIAELGHVSRLDAAVAENLTQFVGRDGELASLVQALKDTQSGSGRFVTVIGDVGVGKSRLLLEFRKAVQDYDVRATVGRCRERGSLTPLLPFVDGVRNMLGVATTAPGEAHDRVITSLKRLAPHLGDYVPVMLHLLSIPSERYPLPPYLEGEDLQAALGEALVSVFTSGSAKRPLMLLLEDWLWADEASKEVLYQLREMVSAHALLIVVTSRPLPSGDSPIPTGDLHLELAPLGGASMVELLRASLNDVRVPDEVAEHVREKTGGNPFFIEELSRTLLDDGTLVIEGNEARLAGSIDRLSIPDTVQAVLKSRLDRLDPEAREVLCCAAVIGRQFGRELLSRVVPSRARLDGALEALRASGLIQRTGLVPEPTYRFKHTLTLDVAYDGLLERHRKERHARVGAALEQILTDQDAEQPATLAAHFAAAEDWEKAVHYGLRSAERAESLWSLPETVETLQHTRDWIELSDKSAEDKRSLLVRLLLDLERLLETLGRRDEQQSAIDDLTDLLPPDVVTADRAEVCVRQGDLFVLQDRMSDARVKIEEALEMAEQLGDRELRVKALRSLGHSLWRQGSYEEAVPWLEEVIETTRDHGASDLKVVDLLNLGRALRRLEDWDRAMAIGDEALDLANKTGNPVDQSYAYNYRGHLFRAVGRTDDAIDSFNQGGALAHEARMPAREAFNKIGVAAIYLEQGQIEAGLDAYRDAVRSARVANRADLLAQALQLLAEALVNCGTAEQSIPYFEEAMSVLKRIGDEVPLAAVMAGLANAQQTAGHADAEATWRAVLELQEHLADQAGTMLALERLAALRRGQDEKESHWLLRRALAHAVELQDAAAEARIRNSLALHAWQARDLEKAEKHYRKAASILRRGLNKQDLGVVLNGLGAVLTAQGRIPEAKKTLDEALHDNRASGRVSAEADSLAALGAAMRHDGDHAAATNWYQQCVERRRCAGDRAGEGWALQRLSEVSRDAGHAEKSFAYAAAAQAIGREIGDKALESQAAGLQSGVSGEDSH